MYSLDSSKLRLAFVFFILLSVFLYSKQPAFAATCSFNQSSGTFVNTSSCTFDYAVDGIDYGTGNNNTGVLQINTGTVTVGAGQEIAVGSLNLTGGSLVIIGGGKLLLNTPLWYRDADGDGAYELGMIASKTQPSGTVARKATNPSATDCGNNANARVGSTYFGTSPFQKIDPITGQTTSSYDYNCDGVESPQYSTIYACSTSGCASHYFTITAGWQTSAPACGASANWRTYPAGAGSSGSCTVNVGGAGTTCPTATTTTVTQGCR